ncbi:MAG TPA: hypothetical protein VHI52_22450, partial [Verrucomicrobiae bacterium]|nr:hypothetical protein [Verrucomicrobiae bacterium]
MLWNSVSRNSVRVGFYGAALLSSCLCGFMPQAQAATVVKVTTGQIYLVQVDHSWVVSQYFESTGKTPTPKLKYFNLAGGNYSTGGAVTLGLTGSGFGGQFAFIPANGLVFAPCPVSTVAPKTKCHNQSGGPSGIGLVFGQATFGAASAIGGYVSNSAGTLSPTNRDLNPGNILAVAVDPANGAFAVGTDTNPTSGTQHGIVLTLDSAGQTYKPIARTDLGTLGGPTSAALDISANGKYVVGISSLSSPGSHAVYALTSASSWTDIAPYLPSDAGSSRAFAANGNGLIAGSYTAKRLVDGKLHSINIGFLFDANTSTVKTFEAPGADVIPLKVLSDGRVIGNLEFIGTGIKANHPFLFDGTNLVDFGTMVLASTGTPAFGCRVNRPNNLGELAGSCIPDNNTHYGAGGSAFYLNAESPTPAYIDVNAAIHAS